MGWNKNINFVFVIINKPFRRRLTCHCYQMYVQIMIYPTSCLTRLFPDAPADIFNATNRVQLYTKSSVYQFQHIHKNTSNQSSRSRIWINKTLSKSYAYILTYFPSLHLWYLSGGWLCSRLYWTITPSFILILAVQWRASFFEQIQILDSNFLENVWPSIIASRPPLFKVMISYSIPVKKCFNS